MNSRVRIGIIGVGYWGPNLVRNFSEIEQVDVAFCCDLNTDRLEYIGGKFPNIKLTTNYADILEDRAVDAVVIVTPVETHFKITEAALKAGKHVFIEKPMTLRSEEADVLVKIAEDLKLKIGTGHIFVSHPAVIEMKKIINSHRIGRSYYAYSVRMNPAPSHGNVDVIWDLAVHDISIALYLWEQMPVQVRASGGKFTHGNQTDAATIELYFSNGTLTYHHVGWLTSTKERTFFLAAEKGSMIFSDTISDKLKIIGPPVDTRFDATAQKGDIFYSQGKIEIPKLLKTEPLKKECQDFINSILGNGDMASNGAFGYEVVKVLEAASLSLKNNSLKINLVKSK